MAGIEAARDAGRSRGIGGVNMARQSIRQGVGDAHGGVVGVMGTVDVEIGLAGHAEGCPKPLKPRVITHSGIADPRP